MEQLTFTEAEVKLLVDFGNFIYRNAKFTCTYAEFKEFEKKYNDFVQHIKKCEDNIMELKAIYQKKEDKKKDASK